eukprot:c8017_g1_i1.p1 GENE.c8017_g1_i1~~c8017_g1_i1.p1  ORF type:complete len:514 (-),score=135.96 c8017_g1_i1:40-1581(-)
MSPRVWFLLAFLSSCVVNAGKISSDMALMPLQTTFPFSNAEMGMQADNIFAFSSFISSKDSADVPFSAKCFLILTSVFVLVNLVIYVVQQVTYYRLAFYPNAETSQKGGTMVSSIFNEVTLGNAKAALTFTPVVALLIIFLLFRAENDGINMYEDKKWRTVEIGIAIVTVGIVLQALDSFTVAFASNTISGIAESLGTLLTYTGYLFLITGMFVVKSSIVPATVAAKCFLTLSLFLLLCLLTIKLVLLKNRLVASLSMPDVFSHADKLLNQQKIEEIQSAAEFAPVMMVVFFYLHFRYVKVGEPSQLTEVGMTGTTVGVFVQAVAVIIKSSFATFPFWLRIIGVLVTYVFLTITMYGAIDAGWPAPSFAIEAVLVLLFLIAFVKLMIVILQEISISIVKDDEVEQGQRFARLTKLFQDMEAAARYGVIVCILLLYIHFRASFLLKVEPQTFIDEIGYLKEMIILAMVCILVQIVVLIVELGVGSNPVMATLVSIAIAGVNIAVAGITYAAIST